MKAAIAAVPALHLSRTAQADSAWLWRLAGLGVAVAVPVAFWTLLLVVLGLVFDFAIGPPLLRPPLPAGPAVTRGAVQSGG